MKQGVLAKRVGVSQGRLSQWENGEHDPSDSRVLNEIAAALETTTDYLLHGITPPADFQRTRPSATGKLKVYGSISAGDGDSAHIDEEEIDVPAECARPDFRALRVDGSSMEPFLFKNDLAIFKVYEGDRVNITRAIEIPGEGWTVKFITKVNGEVKPVPANPAYQIIDGEFRLAGYLVGFIRDIGPEREIRLNPNGLQPKDHEKGALAQFLKF